MMFFINFFIFNQRTWICYNFLKILKINEVGPKNRTKYLFFRKVHFFAVFWIYDNFFFFFLSCVGLFLTLAAIIS